MKARSGFTLVEILIVVIILGILAAIVIPQFTDASTQAKESACRSILQTVRSQVELYQIQHNDDLPGAGTASWVAAMTGQTDIAGAVGTDYGPYLDRMSGNPYDNDPNVTEGTGTPGSGSGWYFHTTTGAFNADDSTEHAAW